jgi:peroxiredoxin Q/BCP
MATRTIRKTIVKKTVKKTKGGKTVKKVTKKTIVTKVVKHAAKKVTVTKDLSVGKKVPTFAMRSTDGDVVTAKGLLGHRYVLYFYPKDMTSGCTVEAHEFSAIAEKFGKKDVLVFGVSPDDLKSHHKFIEKEGITFPLLEDAGHKVADAFGVWVKKSMYGRSYMGIERSTFVVGKTGKIEQVYRKVSPEGHAVCVLGDLAK